MSLFSRALTLTASNVTRAWKTPKQIISYSFSSLPQNSAAPRVQGLAPNFEGTAVIDQDFKQIKLSDFKGKYLVFYFYPLDFTFVCPTEIIAFSEMYDEFKKIDTEIVACSTDSHFSHLAWKNLSRKAGGIGEIKYPLLSDFTKTISRDYGILIEKSGIALRGLFIIDGKGVIRHLSVNDLPVGRSVEEILRLVKAFQFNDKHGEGIQISQDAKNKLMIEEPKIPSLYKKSFKDKVKHCIVGNKDERKKIIEPVPLIFFAVCPANWKPESETIKPTPKDSKEYFGKVNK